MPLLLLPSCSDGLARPPPALPSEQQSHARVEADPLQPLIVEWPASERVELEAKLQQGPVVVRYDGRTMRVLSRCQSPGAYAFQRTQTHRDSLSIDNQDALRAQLPLGAASLSSSLSRLGALRLDLTLIGAYSSSEPDIARGSLRGDCGGATHLVASVTVGAFELRTASSTSLGGGAAVSGVGGGAESSSRREILARAGDLDACQSAPPEARVPPGCGALVRLGLRPLVDPEPRPEFPAAVPSSSVAPPSPQPARPVAARPLLAPAPLAPSPEPAPRSAFWPTMAGVGVLALLAGAVVAGVLLSKGKDTPREPVPSGGLGNVSLPAGVRW